MRRMTMLVAAWIVLVSAAAFAGDWPQWHGPNRDGTVLDSPPLVEEFPKEGPKKLWESEAIPGGEYNGGY
ncbi:MAG TPA: pyrrolo-quinoline quinone, partial [Planctomycetota bacterium]|nr:pyrrolo-quinoline quinone [Planctomycetota bacterium]